MTTAIRALFTVDVRNIARDSMLKFFILYPFILGLLLRWLIPFVEEGLVDTYDLAPLHPLLVSFFGIVIVPALGGVIIGFLLLDERDAQTLTALQVTPLSMRTYLGYRIAMPILLTVASIFIVIPLINLMPVNLVVLLPISVLVSLSAPIFALFLINFATNKVQGFAVMKVLSLFLSMPFVAWFIPEPWQWLFGVFPTFWPLKAFWVHHAGGEFAHLMLIGLAVALLYLIPLMRRFNTNSYRTG